MRKNKTVFYKRLTGLCCLPVLLALVSLAGCTQGSGSAATETATPAAETTSSVAETTSTAAETTASAAETTSSAAETTASAAETTSSAAETTASMTETTSAAEAVTEESVSYDYNSGDFLQIKNYWRYAPVAPISGVKEDGSYFQLHVEKLYRGLQGSCTDGTYVYMLLNNPRAKFENNEYTALSILYKVDLSTWEIVAQSEPLAVDHGGSITYNSKINLLVVANATPNHNLITQIDPETLTITDVITSSVKLGAISYNATRDQYVIRTGRDNFAILDADFNLLTQYTGIDGGFGFQNVDTDDDYIYIIDSSVNKQPYAEMIFVYDWNGNYAGVFRIDSAMEVEGMFHVGDEYYITFNSTGGKVYKIEIDKSLLNEPQ